MHIAVVVEPSAFDYTTEVAEQTAVVAQTAFVAVAVVQTTTMNAPSEQNTSVIAVVVVPPMAIAAVVAPFYGPLPSRSTCPSFCPGLDHMHDNPYLHSQ